MLHITTVPDTGMHARVMTQSGTRGHTSRPRRRRNPRLEPTSTWHVACEEHGDKEHVDKEHGDKQMTKENG
jgi:hypothetical protein